MGYAYTCENVYAPHWFYTLGFILPTFEIRTWPAARGRFRDTSTRIHLQIQNTNPLN